MSPASVERVLELIDRLSDDERLILEKQLSQRLDAQWDEAVAENRRVAQERGITEEMVDRAIHRRRYGK
jgi:hypothetical protein